MEKGYGYLYKNSALRLQILEDIFKLISDLEVTLISSVVDKDKYFYQFVINDVEQRAWTHLIERCDMYISDLMDKKNTNENGLIITDHFTSYAHEERISQFLQLMRIQGHTGWHILEHLIEEPLFASSKLNNLIQIADCVAYCSVMKLIGEQFFTNQYEIISQKFRQGPLNQQYGFKVFP